MDCSRVTHQHGAFADAVVTLLALQLNADMRRHQMSRPLPLLSAGVTPRPEFHDLQSIKLASKRIQGLPGSADAFELAAEN